MNIKFTILSAIVGSVLCMFFNLNIMQSMLVLIMTNMIWSVICHYNDWFLDI